MNYYTMIKGNSYDLLRAVKCVPERYTCAVLVEKTCIAAKLNVLLEAFATEDEARKFFNNLDLRGVKGTMKHFVPSIDRLREYAENVHKVRVRMFLDDEEEE